MFNWRHNVWIDRLVRKLISLRPAPSPKPLGERAVFYVWHYPFTAYGKWLVAAFFAAALIGGVTVEIPAFQIPVALFLLTAVTSLPGSLMRWGSFTLTGRFPETVVAGEPLAGQFQFRNENRFDVFDVEIGSLPAPGGWTQQCQPPGLASVAAGESVNMEVVLVPPRRGRYELNHVRAYTTFPFHLFRNELARCEGGGVLVLPQFTPMQRVRLELGLRYQSGGIAFASQVGESPEYIGNRDYVPGDPLRRVDFRSWARLARPVVKEFADEFFCRIALVLDTRIPQGRRIPPQGDPALEAAVSLTAALAERVSFGEYLVEIFAAGDGLHYFRTGRHTAPVDRILEVLACVEPHRGDPFIQLRPALVPELRSISAVVCVFLDWDSERASFVSEAITAGCSVKVLLVRDGPPTNPLSTAAGVDAIALSPRDIAAGKVVEV
jgi:uncharacterized protein (DUF58 family)